MSMAESERPSGIVELATEAVAPIEEELRQRLLAEVGDQDSLAIESALLKAFIDGMRARTAETAESVVERTNAFTALGSGQIPPTTELEPALPRIDPWADRYGGGE
ncbi:MAG: hypothetical protein ACLQBY_11670 [Solirubrobacteraceae bacterium]